ncbi:J domain-containing protein [Sulfurospirillum sp. 1612]|uniref:J domain-containing protein n=1 Tax=Sulfurospirillum sp. 1612 TaxID=3094835 RepID=UPI002F934453
MQILCSRNSISIHIIEDTKAFYFLQNLAEKKFAKTIGKKSKFIIFQQAEEHVQRRYFLKLISKMYASKNKNFTDTTLQSIQNSVDKNIKISLIKANQISQCINISMVFEEDFRVKFVFDTAPLLLINYLKIYFKDHATEYSYHDKTLTISPLASKTARLLSNLLEQKELLGAFVTFKYDKKRYSAYQKFLENKSYQDVIQDSLHQFLEEHYRVLGCVRTDSFKVVRAHYLKLAKKYHPDRFESTSRFLNKYYTKKFYHIQHAYNIIKLHHDHEKKSLFVA